MNQWGVLQSRLAAVGAAEQVAPGHLRVTFANSTGRSITVDMWVTRLQWEEMVGVMYGGYVDQAVGQVLSALEGLGRERHLVYGLYELVPSMDSELPPGYLF